MNQFRSIKENPTVLVCKPDPKAARRLGDYLIRKGFVVSLIYSSRQAIKQIIEGVPDVVILDVQLPISGGYEVCRLVRPGYGGLIIVHGQAQDDAAQLLAFERGADDYVTASSSAPLLTAKIMAHLKRRDCSMTKRTHRRRIQVGELLLDAGRREVFSGGEPIELTAMQFELLWQLARRSGQVISRKDLYKSLYRDKYNEHDRSIDICISRIRRRLNDDVENPVYLKTIRGKGYLLMS